MTKVTVREYAAFSYDVYFETQQNTARELPAGWSLFETCPESWRLYGYFGASYIRVNQDSMTVDLVIAHRGTDNLYGAIEDTELWLTNHVPAQFHYGVKPFVNHLINTVEKQYSTDAYQLNWYVTGHSLGGTLAELTIADNEITSMTGLSFESPGSVTLIEQMEAENYLPKGALTYAKSLDKSGNPVATSVKTRPDEINTLQPTPNPPIGPVPVPNVYPANIFGVLPIDPGYLDYTYYSFCVEHPMKNILEWINNNDISKLPVMLKPWPMGFFAGYRWYKSYEENKDYWDGYIDELWNNDGLLSSMIQFAFSRDFEKFKSYYMEYFLYQACESAEQKNKVEAFLQYLIDKHSEHSNALKSDNLSVSQLTHYLPDQQKIDKKPLATDMTENKTGDTGILAKLVPDIGFFKQPVNNKQDVTSFDCTYSI